MDRRNEVFENLTPDPKQPSFDEYFKRFKMSFHRIWENSFLWFWGMFLPGSIGIGFNINEKVSKLNSEETVNLQIFVVNNLGALCFLFGIVLLLWILIWCVSAVSRSGVIQILSRLQNKKNKKKFYCKSVWGCGKKHFKSILLLDFFAGMMLLLVFLILLTPVTIMILMGNQAGAIFLFITLLIFFFVFAIFMNYVLQIATIYVVLANMEVFGAFTVAARLLVRNLLEVSKLFSIFFLIGLLQGTVFLLIMMAVTPFWGKIVNIWITLHENSFVEWMIFSSLLIFVLTMLCLFAKAIFSLWIQDIWVWWVKEIGGNKSEEEEKEPKYEEQLDVIGAMARKKGIVYSE